MEISPISIIIVLALTAEIVTGDPLELKPFMLREGKNAHGLSSGKILVKDDRTLEITNLHYDGGGPDAFFIVGTGDPPVERPSKTPGLKIPNEKGDCGVLKAYTGETIKLVLPAEFTVHNIDWLAVYCIKYKHTFGFVEIPKSLKVPEGKTETSPKTCSAGGSEGTDDGSSSGTGGGSGGTDGSSSGSGGGSGGTDGSGSGAGSGSGNTGGSGAGVGSGNTVGSSGIQFNNQINGLTGATPTEKVLTGFIRKEGKTAHDLSSGKIKVKDTRRLEIPNLYYDGKGPDAFFMVGTGGAPENNPSETPGHKIPNEKGNCDVLKQYNGETITLTLPADYTVKNIDWLSMYCIKYKSTFGYVVIPKNLEVPDGKEENLPKPCSAIRPKLNVRVMSFIMALLALMSNHIK